MSDPPSLLDRLRQRKLVQWTVAYAAVAWGLVQVTDLLAAQFGWPPWVPRSVTVLAGFGFAAVLVAAWFHGERGYQRIAPLEIALLAGIAAAAAGTTLLLGVGGRVEARPQSEAAGDARASIAVLPFVNLSADPEQLYFSDGIAEELLNLLSATPELRVAARTSTFVFRDRQLPLDSIARALNVTHVLEGSVRRAGDQVRITAKLVDARTGFQLWGRTFERRLADVFAIQDEISRAIADELRLSLRAGDGRQRVPTVGAHDLYLLGLERWNRRNAAALQEALEYFEAAVAADPDYVHARAGLALGRAVLPQYDAAAPARELFESARAEALHVLQLDSTSAAAWAALSQVSQYLGEYQRSEQEARAAVRLNPNYATAHQWLAEALYRQARFTEAVAAADRAAALDPLNAVIAHIRASVYAAADRTDDAIAEFRRAAELNPELMRSRTQLVRVGLDAGRFDEVQPVLRTLFQQAGLDAALADSIIAGYRDEARRARLAQLAADPGVTRVLGFWSTGSAMLYERAGDRDAAVRLLLAGPADHPVYLADVAWMLLFPGLRSLRSDPRIAPLVREYGPPAN